LNLAGGTDLAAGCVQSLDKKNSDRVPRQHEAGHVLSSSASVASRGRLRIRSAVRKATAGIGNAWSPTGRQMARRNKPPRQLEISKSQK
jgi:hypothetical protein